jgi:hypothetical protein
MVNYPNTVLYAVDLTSIPSHRAVTGWRSTFKDLRGRRHRSGSGASWDDRWVSRENVEIAMVKFQWNYTWNFIRGCYMML